MKFLLYIQILTASLLVSGCSSSSPESVKVNAGPIAARTFSFVTPSARQPEGTDGREAVHRMIQGSITRNLASKGVTKAASGDLTVAYLVVIGNNVSTESISDYFGYSDETEKLHLKAHDAYIDSKSRNHFEAGTLVIDVIDSRTRKLIKRGYATSPLLRNLPANERNAKVQEAVNSILSDLRITP